MSISKPCAINNPSFSSKLTPRFDFPMIVINRFQTIVQGTWWEKNFDYYLSIGACSNFIRFDPLDKDSQASYFEKPSINCKHEYPPIFETSCKKKLLETLPESVSQAITTYLALNPSKPFANFVLTLRTCSRRNCYRSRPTSNAEI